MFSLSSGTKSLPHSRHERRVRECKTTGPACPPETSRSASSGQTSTQRPQATHSVLEKCSSLRPATLRRTSAPVGQEPAQTPWARQRSLTSRRGNAFGGKGRPCAAASVLRPVSHASRAGSGQASLRTAARGPGGGSAGRSLRAISLPRRPKKARRFITISRATDGISLGIRALGKGWSSRCGQCAAGSPHSSNHGSSAASTASPANPPLPAEQPPHQPWSTKSSRRGRAAISHFSSRNKGMPPKQGTRKARGPARLCGTFQHSIVIGRLPDGNFASLKPLAISAPDGQTAAQRPQCKQSPLSAGPSAPTFSTPTRHDAAQRSQAAGPPRTARQLSGRKESWLSPDSEL